MDSLFCKIGSLRALVPAPSARPCEGPSDASQAAQAAPRSVQICACGLPPPPPSPQLKSPSGEEGTSKQGNGSILPSFNPLPLLSLNSEIPAPLKFLWFNRSNQQATERDQDLRAPGYAGGYEENILFNDTEKGIEGEEEKLQLELELNDVLQLMESQDITDWSEVDVHGQKASINNLNTLLQDEGIAKKGNLETVDVNNVGKDSSKCANSSEHPAGRSSPLRRERSWMSKIADIKAFWPDPKTFFKQSTSTQAPTSSSSHGSSQVACHMLQNSEAEGNDVPCNLDGALGCSLEPPYTKVTHTKESFSKFLQDASLYDMKVYAQLAFLCDMAYMIPDIQPGQLMKYHHLRLVTSSLEKKAEAESKAKEGEPFRELGASGKGSVDNGCAKSNVEPSQSNLCSQTEQNSVQPSKAAHSNSVQTDGPCLTEESKAPSLSQADHNKISSSLLESSEGNKPLDKDSAMAVAPAAATVVAEEETKLTIAKDLQSSRPCPCEWFVCDEPSSYTRIFVIQGSESLASWQANLFFEPTKFEDLDVFVHHGIYEAANALYDQVLPEVLAHVSVHGDLAQTRFTGHSLGGSLATLLALMFQIRGVLPSSAILPVVTFGSPCIMCGGDYLLQNLKLPKSHIQSVMMHRDVVPRAFACDYPDHVAEVLKRLNGRFRDHPCLNNQKLLYAPMGQFLILQPDESAAPSHPLLPDGHGLYVLRHPMNGDDIKNAIELRGAQRAFLNMPHPLDILGDPGAYGFDGAMSRDHDPRSYTKTIHVVLKDEVKRLRRVQREQRRQLWWPLVLAESSSLLQKGTSTGASLDHLNRSRALTPSLNETSRIFQQPATFALAKHVGFSMRGRSIWEAHKGAFSKYRRLKHVQMGMLLVLSLQVVIVECLSTLLVWV